MYIRRNPEKPLIKAQNLGDGVPQPKAGFCLGCREWDTELKDGFCRDAECRRKRLLIAYAHGKAIVYVDGIGSQVRVFSQVK